MIACKLTFVESSADVTISNFHSAPVIFLEGTVNGGSIVLDDVHSEETVDIGTLTTSAEESISMELTVK